MSQPASETFRAAFERRRFAKLAPVFEARFGSKPQFGVRAPGRVNLLGEHTDYNGLPVLPMAIERSVIIAGRARRDRRVLLHNVHRRFAPREFALSDIIEAGPAGDWGNYVKAATQGLWRDSGELRRGADLLVDGNIPSGAGLSSSSALVVASALALLAANRVEVEYAHLAELLPAAERYVGTLSGGMDQAISLLAQADHALRIDFFPLRARPVRLPAAARIVVCDSLVEAAKSGAAKQAYNQRVIEGRLACRLLEAALGSNLPRPLTTLGDLVTLFPGHRLSDFLQHVTQLIPEGPLSLKEIAAVVGTSPAGLAALCEIPPATPDQYTVVSRLRHVLGEAERVDECEVALASGDLRRFGALMDASHRSCRDDYEISCPELETLVRCAKKSGALGARLTGAGFGGCTVNLVEADQLDELLTRLDRDFYRRRVVRPTQWSRHRFVFTAQSGAETVLS